MSVDVIIFDFNRTLYDPGNDSLYEGVGDLLTSLKARGIILVLVTKCIGDRKNIVKSSGIVHLFDAVHYVTEKSQDLFMRIRSDYDGEIWSVGDVISREIEYGNLCGMTTVRVLQGIFSEDVPGNKCQIADYEIDDIKGLKRLIV